MFKSVHSDKILKNLEGIAEQMHKITVVVDSYNESSEEELFDTMYVRLYATPTFPHFHQDKLTCYLTSLQQ